MRAARAASVVLLALIAAPLSAQKLVPVGARVKVSLDEEYRQAETRSSKRMVIRGEVTQETADSMWIRLTRATAPVAVSKNGMRALFVSRGEPRRLRSFVVDGLAGAIVGAIEAAIFYHAFGTNFPSRAGSRGEAAARYAVVGGVVFGVIGFVLPVEYWRRVPID